MLLTLPQAPWGQMAHRYPVVRGITTQLDPFQDLIIFLEFLTSSDFVVDNLVNVHLVSNKEARLRAKQVVPHARFAVAYVQQALAGPAEISFLPAYYAVLNMLKICVLVGPHHARMRENRWHGASYDGYAKNSKTLLSEEITIRPTGAIPLFYEAITGRKLGRRPQRLRMVDVYPYILNIGAEWTIATGIEPPVIGMLFRVETPASDRRIVKAKLFLRDDLRPKFSIRSCPVLRGFTKHATEENVFVRETRVQGNPSDADAIRAAINSTLLYGFFEQKVSLAPLSARRLVFPEELPIALALFHLGSVARYKPEYLARLRDSRYWPVIAALRVHGLYRMMMLTISYATQETVVYQTK